MQKWYRLVHERPKNYRFADHNYFDRQAVCSYSHKSTSVRKAGSTHNYSIFLASKMQIVTITSIERARRHAKDEWSSLHITFLARF
jgi:hypothetical protein